MYDVGMLRVGAVLVLCAACSFSVEGVPTPDAPPSPPDVPVDTPEVKPTCPAAEVVAGGDHACARTDDGAVYCWGLAAYGQVGISPLSMRCPSGGGMPYCSPTPAKVQMLSAATALGAGGYHSCAATSAGAMCWGLNSYGAFGNGTAASSMLPLAIPARAGAETIVGGSYHTCSIAGGRVFCSGQNAAGEVGNGAMTLQLTAVPVLQDATAVALGDYTTCAIDTQQRLQCWGRNTYRTIDPTGVNRLTPTVVDGATDVVDVAVGRHHVCTVHADKTATCRGNNTYGQLGNGQVATLSPPVTVGVDAVTRVFAERNVTCVLDEAGAVSCFGEGIGTTPTQIPLPAPATSVSLGNAFACAVTNDATVWCWGSNTTGQLGNGSFGEPSVPTPQRVELCP